MIFEIEKSKRSKVFFDKVDFDILLVSKQGSVELAKVERSKSEFELLNPPRLDGFPKVKEIGLRKFVKANEKDPNYDLPLSKLNKTY